MATLVFTALGNALGGPIGGEPPVMIDRPCERRRSQHDPPEPGMGVDEPAAGRGDDQVMLRWSRPDQQHVAGRDRPGRFPQPGPRRRAEKPLDRSLPQPVARGRGCRPPDPGKRSRDQSDAIEPARRIAAMQPERHADQALGRAREAGHRADPGWRASRSLPGTNGSP